MTSDAWNDMKKAKEESYFDRKNREALERLASSQSKEKPRLSPITGEPMERVALGPVIVDRCPTSGGIWLDAGELEQIVEMNKQPASGDEGSVFDSFLKGLLGMAKK